MELFLATECPISNRYVPELNRLAAAYPTVLWASYFPEPELTNARLGRWRDEFKPGFPAHVDLRGVAARKAGATVTPQAVIYLGQRLVYRGRIDDRYVSWGKARREPTRRDVAETLDLLLQGQVPALRETKSWGCFVEARRV